MKNEILFTELSNISDKVDDRLYEFVSEEKKAYLKNFKYIVDCKLSLYAELLVRQKIMNITGIKNEEIIFSKGSNGKPFLVGYPKINFNISHTRNALAVAFSEEEIGVDIERAATADLQVAKRCFCDAELDYLYKHENINSAFFEIWTKKEAYIKSSGIGLNIPLKSFCVIGDSRYKTFYAGDYIISAFEDSDRLSRTELTPVIPVF
ncbi:MAG: 4'-phosphopantetheinyl transferase superfamily protein [Ruminococcus sp.]|jgi:4'-phosphopantetheinyl transferase|nr:4'-phosphopantetheinyl transferase superfamily protein [Ruminococcus sp.]